MSTKTLNRSSTEERMGNKTDIIIKLNLAYIYIYI